MKSKKKDKAYIKALDYYENGELDKAIKQCDKVISKNINNRAAFNLKGLILYIKGDLHGAVETWKLNVQYNVDNLAKNYIADSRSDLQRLRLYGEAEKLIAELKIDEAIRLLKSCKQSTFNSIKVNTSLAICYMRKGDYKACSLYIREILNQDKNNSDAKKIAKELYDIGKIKVKTSSKGSAGEKIIISIVSIVLIASVSALTVFVLQNRMNNNIEQEVAVEETEEDKQQETTKEDKENIEAENPENDTDKTGNTNVEVNVDFEALQKDIANKDYEAVYSKLETIGNTALEGKEKTIYISAKELLKSEGVKYFYQQGSEGYNSGLLEEARVELKKAYKYAADDNYLLPHIIFFDATASEKLGDNSEAIKMYEEYYKKYPTGDYRAEVTYKLAILYKDVNIDVSIAYAEDIRESYSDTMYNNDVISNLLNSVE